MKLLTTSSKDAKHNLAVEEFLTYSYDSSEPILFLWQNNNSIIVGRNQNTFAEINISAAQKDNVAIVRRNTGGGTVYHDLGNICYSYIDYASNVGLGFQITLLPIIEYLDKLGLDSKFVGRNDLEINGKKISGNAQLKTKTKILQHGTLLFNSKIEKMSNYLNVNQEKMKHHKVKSIIKRVTNIDTELKAIDVEMTMKEFKEGLLHSLKQANKPELIKFNEEELAAIALLQKEKYESEIWTFEKNATFEITESKYVESVGFIQINLNVEKQKISQIKIFGDFFSQRNLKNIYDELLNKKFNKEIITNILDKMDLKEYFGDRITTKDIIDILFNNKEK